MLRAPRGALSTVTLSVVSLHGCGHGYAMAGGEMLPVAMENGARERARAREKRGKEERLKSSAEGVETGSGKGRSWRGGEVDLAVGRLKTWPWRR